MQPWRGSAAHTTDHGLARCVGTVILLLLAVGASAAPATAASPAVRAATASGTPVIPPPKPKPKPFTCTPNKKTKRCTKTARKCRTVRGVRICDVKRVTCRRIGRYKRCVLTTSTCRTVKSKRTGKSRTTCRRTGRKTTITRISASIASGPIARFTLRLSGQPGTPRATRLVSTTTAAAPPVASAAASPGPTVPPGAAIGALVLVLALVGLTITRRPRSRD